MGHNKLTLRELEGDLKTYFNWSANALASFNPNATDIFLKNNRSAIVSTAQHLLKDIGYRPENIYRGILLKDDVDTIYPLKNIQYLSFSERHPVAEHFANTKGFGSNIVDVEKQLGKYGYLIEYTPTIDEVLFHHDFLFMLPYAEAYTLLGMDGEKEVEGLKQQYEIMILQPKEPLINITKMFQ